METLRFLMTYFVTDFELIHLRKLADASQPFPYNKTDGFVNELRRLRALGFVANYPDKGIRSMPPAGDLREYFKITDRGTTYLQLRSEWDADQVLTAPDKAGAA